MTRSEVWVTGSSPVMESWGYCQFPLNTGFLFSVNAFRPSA